MNLFPEHKLKHAFFNYLYRDEVFISLISPHITSYDLIIVYYAKWQHRKNTIIYTKYKNTFTKQNIKTDYKLKLQFILYYEQMTLFYLN